MCDSPPVAGPAAPPLAREGDVLRLLYEKDGTPHYHWQATVVQTGPGGAVLTRASAGTPFVHHGRGFVRAMAHEVFVAVWPQAWFSGGWDLDPAAGLVGWYFNLHRPPRRLPATDGRPAILAMADLDLDLAARGPHGPLRLLDAAEFRARHPSLPRPERAALAQAIRTVRRLYRTRAWPLDVAFAQAATAGPPAPDRLPPPPWEGLPSR